MTWPVYLLIVAGALMSVVCLVLYRRARPVPKVRQRAVLHVIGFPSRSSGTTWADFFPEFFPDIPPDGAA